MDGKSTLCRNVNVSENQLLRMDVLWIVLNMTLVPVVSNNLYYLSLFIVHLKMLMVTLTRPRPTHS